MAYQRKRIESYVHKTFGVWPIWTLAQSNIYKSKWKYAVNKYLQIALNLFYVSSFVASVYYDRVILSKNVPLIMKIGNNLSMYLGVSLMLSTWQLKFSHLDVIFDNLTEMDGEIAALLGTTSEVRKTKFVQFRMESIFVIIFSICFIFITFYDSLMYDSEIYIVVLDYFPYAYPYFVASSIILQFISLINLIHLRFEIVNESMRSLLNKCQTMSMAVPFAELFTVEKSIARMKREQQQLYEAKMKKVKNHYDIITEKSIRKLFELHDRLLQISEKVNDCYSLHTVIYVTVAFVYTIFGLLFEAKELFYDLPEDLSLSMMATSYTLWAVQYLSIIFALWRLCEATRQSAYETAVIVHKIVQQKPEFLEKFDIYYNKMKSFTIQMLHRKKSFNFNGVGLFNFDYTFIFSAVSAATSYLIVLLQFDMSFDRTPDPDGFPSFLSF